MANLLLSCRHDGTSTASICHYTGDYRLATSGKKIWPLYAIMVSPVACPSPMSPGGPRASYDYSFALVRHCFSTTAFRHACLLTVSHSPRTIPFSSFAFSLSHFPHLHFVRPSPAPYDPLPHPHVSTWSFVFSTA